MDRCDICGKFRKHEELIHRFTPDSYFSSEDSYYECVFCSKNKNNKILKLRQEAMYQIKQLKGDNNG
jgi:hypothetical protein